MGEGATSPLNHCLSWSRALPPPLSQRTCGAEARPSTTPSGLEQFLPQRTWVEQGGKTECHGLHPCRSWDGPPGQHLLGAGLTLRYKVSPGSGVLGKSQSSHGKGLGSRHEFFQSPVQAATP